MYNNPCRRILFLLKSIYACPSVCLSVCQWAQKRILLMKLAIIVDTFSNLLRLSSIGLSYCKLILDFIRIGERGW